MILPVSFWVLLISLDRASFVNTSKWIEDVRAERGADVVMVLVGNKSDLSEKRSASLQPNFLKTSICRRW
jgi:Ras-related protein Rab-6A